MSKEYEALKCEACGANLPEGLVCEYCRTVHGNKATHYNDESWHYRGAPYTYGSGYPIAGVIMCSTGLADLYIQNEPYNSTCYSSNTTRPLWTIGTDMDNEELTKKEATWIEKYEGASNAMLTHLSRLSLIGDRFLEVTKEFRECLGSPIVIKGGKEESYKAFDLIRRYEAVLAEQGEVSIDLIDDVGNLVDCWDGMLEAFRERLELMAST